MQDLVVEQVHAEWLPVLRNSTTCQQYSRQCLTNHVELQELKTVTFQQDDIPALKSLHKQGYSPDSSLPLNSSPEGFGLLTRQCLGIRLLSWNGLLSHLST